MWVGFRNRSPPWLLPPRPPLLLQSLPRSLLRCCSVTARRKAPLQLLKWVQGRRLAAPLCLFRGSQYKI